MNHAIATHTATDFDTAAAASYYGSQLHLDDMKVAHDNPMLTACLTIQMLVNSSLDHMSGLTVDDFDLVHGKDPLAFVNHQLHTMVNFMGGFTDIAANFSWLYVLGATEHGPASARISS